MAIPVLESVKAIEQQYRTGEEPVLVMCSDMNAYVCKYMRSSAVAYKLACELIGSLMAMAWQLETPDIAFVRIKSAHWAGRFAQHSLSAPSLGSKLMEGVVDVTPSTYGDVASTTAIDAIVSELKTVYAACLKRSKRQVKQIVEGLPKEWNVPSKVVEEKLQQLFDEQWTTGVWDNFVECLNENISNG